MEVTAWPLAHLAPPLGPDDVHVWQTSLDGDETAFAALHTRLVLPGLIDLGILVERMTAGGEPFGVEIPSLAPRSPANVCLADLAAEWEVGEAGYESRSSNCAFGGQRLTGRVRMTIAAGTVAYRERSFAIGAV